MELEGSSPSQRVGAVLARGVGGGGEDKGDFIYIDDYVIMYMIT